MQLAVGEANFAAKELGLKEPLPIVVPTDKDQWEIGPPPNGFEVYLSGQNYSFEFRQGRLHEIRKDDWLKKITPPITQFWELSERPSLLDTNTAYQLATQWLSSLSIDVAELERKHSPRVFQVPARKTDKKGRAEPGLSSLVALPLFMIGWGEDEMNPKLKELMESRARERNRAIPVRPPNSRCPAFVEVMGTTKELIELTINDASLIKRPALQITNAAELLGPTPPPQHFVEEFLGGREAYETIARPDKVEAWLLTSRSSGASKRDRAGPVKLTPQTSRMFSDVLLNFDSYRWGVTKNCVMDEGARLRFTRTNGIVDVRLCYECDMLTVSHNGSTKHGDFDPGHNSLVKALQLAFPKDQIVATLKLKGKSSNED